MFAIRAIKGVQRRFAVRIRCSLTSSKHFVAMIYARPEEQTAVSLDNVPQGKAQINFDTDQDGYANRTVS